MAKTKRIAQNSISRRLEKSDIFHYFYSSIGLIIAVGLILIFRKIAGNLTEPRLVYFDEGIYQIFRYIASPTTDFIAETASFFGSTIFILPLLIVSVLFLVKNHFRRGAFILAFSTISTILINSLLKSVFVRNRPEVTDYHLLWQDYSFPSGHAMSATVFYCVLGYLIVNFEKNPTLKIIYSFSFFLITISVAMSRVALGLHYFSDVLAAMAIGGFWAIWNIYIIKIIYRTK